MTNELTFKEAAEQVQPSQFMDYRLYLDSLYHQIKVLKKPYSYKKFAGDLGFGETTVMHQIVNGYRPLTVKTAKQIAKALDLKSKELAYFLALVEYVNARSGKKKDELFQGLVDLKRDAELNPLNKDWLAYCSSWVHPVIRELVGVKGFRGDVEWIKRKVNVPLTDLEIKESLDLLLRLDLIGVDPKTRKYVQTNTRLSTGSRVKGMGLVRFHQEMIQLSRESLTRIAGKRRNISAMTLACDEETAQAIAAKIASFQKEILDLAEQTKGDQVYQMNIQLFPFTGSDDDQK